MEYLSEKNGWEHIFAGNIRYDSIFCDYIEDFVSKTGLINVKDPQAHFYYNDKKDKHKLYMIDYGNCEECKNFSVSKSECIELMNSALGVNCDKGRTTIRTEEKRNITKTSNGAKYNSGGTKTHKRIKNTKKKLHKSKTHKKRKSKTRRVRK